MTEDLPLIAQVSNVSTLATIDQMEKLFGFMGKIKDIRMYPTVSVMQPQFKVCYIKYAESWSVRVAMHLTNTVFIDRALVVVAIPGDTIPSEDNTAFDLHNPVSALPGLLSSGFKDVSNDIAAVDGNLVITSVDTNLDILGLPQYPPLAADQDPNTIEEIRRTVYIENISTQVTATQLLDFINGVVGEVKYLRMAGQEKNMTQSAFVEFTDRASIVKALQCDGITLKGNKLKIQHSSSAIVKPQKETEVISEKDTEEAMKRLKEAESLIARVVEPEISGKSSRSRRRSSSRSRRRSSSRSRRRSRSNSRRSSRKRDKRSRSKDRRRSRSPRRRSTSRRRKSRSRSKHVKARRSRSRSKPRRSRSRSRPRRSRSRSKTRHSKRSYSRSRRSRSKTSEAKSKTSKKSRRSRSRSIRSRRSHRSRSRSNLARSKRRSHSRSERSRSPSRLSRSKRDRRSSSRSPTRSKKSKRSTSKSLSSPKRDRSRSRSKTSDVKESLPKPIKVITSSRSPSPESSKQNEVMDDKNKEELDSTNNETNVPSPVRSVGSPITSFPAEEKMVGPININELPSKIEEKSEVKTDKEDCSEKDATVSNKESLPIEEKERKSRTKSKSRSRSRSKSKISSKSGKSRKVRSRSKDRKRSRSPARKIRRRRYSSSDSSSSVESRRKRDKSSVSRPRSRSPRVSSKRSSRRSPTPKYRSRSDKKPRYRRKSRSRSPRKRSVSRSPRRSLTKDTGSDKESSSRQAVTRKESSDLNRERKRSFESDVRNSDSD